MELIVYDFGNDNAILATYRRCKVVPRKGDAIRINGKLGSVKTGPVFDFEKNVIYTFVSIKNEEKEL
jgi:hypothetical protein